MKPGGASISLPTSQALPFTSRVLSARGLVEHGFGYPKQEIAPVVAGCKLMGKVASSLMVAKGNSVENPPRTTMAPADKPPGLI